MACMNAGNNTSVLSSTWKNIKHQFQLKKQQILIFLIIGTCTWRALGNSHKLCMLMHESSCRRLVGLIWKCGQEGTKEIWRGMKWQWTRNRQPSSGCRECYTTIVHVNRLSICMTWKNWWNIWLSCSVFLYRVGKGNAKCSLANSRFGFVVTTVTNAWRSTRGMFCHLILWIMFTQDCNYDQQVGSPNCPASGPGARMPHWRWPREIEGRMRPTLLDCCPGWVLRRALFHLLTRVWYCP